jgi:hypothetical protein
MTAMGQNSRRQITSKARQRMLENTTARKKLKYDKEMSESYTLWEDEELGI